MNDICSLFDSQGACTSEEPKYRVSYVDFGHGTTAKEAMNENARCQQGQISLGKFCI